MEICLLWSHKGILERKYWYYCNTIRGKESEKDLYSTKFNLNYKNLIDTFLNCILHINYKNSPD